MRPISIVDVCKRLKPFMGNKADQLYLKYTVSEDRDDKDQLQRMLNILYEKHLNTTLLEENVLLEPPKNVEGEYPLATVEYAEKEFGSFGLRSKDWPRHVCVTGMSGSGKTTFAFKMLHNFIKNDIPFLIFDWKKSFRPLMDKDNKILCFTVGNDQVSNNFRININKPPRGVGPKEWVGMMCDLIVESFFASYGVHKVFREVLDQAFRDFGVYAGTGNYPTWLQIKDRLIEMSDDMGKGNRRESEWLESALRIVDSLTYGSFGEAICSKDPFGMDVEDLLDEKVIFELNALGNAEKKFFCEYILLNIYLSKKFNQTKYSSDFKNAIIVDEAHHIFLKDKPNFVRESTTEIVYRELREYGISLICLDQHISKISDVVAGNSATNIAFQQVLPEDVKTVAGLMQIYEDKKFFSMLPVGGAIVKLAERHHMPFKIQVPFIDTKEVLITDEEIKKRMKLKMTDIRAQNKADFKTDSKNIRKALEKASGILLKSGVTITLDQDHKSFMEILCKSRKEMSITEAYKKLGLSARRCNTLKKDLVAQGIIEIEEKKNKQGLKKIVKLSEKGLTFIET